MFFTPVWMGFFIFNHPIHLNLSQLFNFKAKKSQSLLLNKIKNVSTKIKIKSMATHHTFSIHRVLIYRSKFSIWIPKPGTEEKLFILFFSQWQWTQFLRKLSQIFWAACLSHKACRRVHFNMTIFSWATVYQLGQTNIDIFNLCCNCLLTTFRS